MAEGIIKLRQGDVKTMYLDLVDIDNEPITPLSAFLKFYNESTGTYTIKGTATCEAGTVYCQLSADVLAIAGTFQNHWDVRLANNDVRRHVQDVEIFALFPTMPSLNYGDLASLKRYVRTVNDSVRIGNSMDADVSQVDAVKFIRDGERYVDARLKKYVDSDNLPISSPPNEICLASNIMGAWFLLNSGFLANAPGEISEAAKGLKTMADNLVDGYVDYLRASGLIVEEPSAPSWQKPTKAFTKRGVKGVTYGDLEGIEEDDDISDEQN